MRCILVNWLVDIADEYNIKDETLFLHLAYGASSPCPSFELENKGSMAEHRMLEPIEGGSSPLLGSRLYAFGGIDGYNKATNKMWSRDLSDPSSQWTARANMKQSRRWFNSVVLNDTIYALGGISKNNNSRCSCERYSSQLNQWSTVAEMNSYRAYASAAAINGCIYIAGGYNEKRKKLQSVCKYCPETDTWREVAPMTTERCAFALTPFAGRLWAIGGVGNDYDPLSSCESYDPVTDTWREEAPMKKERWGHAAIELNGELYVVGGFRNQVEIYDIRNNSWHTSSLSLQLPNGQHMFQLALLYDSELYAFGGKDKDFNSAYSVWSRSLGDPASQWTARAPMNKGRNDPYSVVLNDDIYVFGGRVQNGRISSCERYSSQLNQWSTVAEMNSYRAYASAAAINGCIYIAGGYNEKRKKLQSVCKYCPETDTWREVAPMTTERCAFALTPFAGRLWAIGGVGNDYDPLSSCESYDPVTDTWRDEAPMKEGRYNHAAMEFNGELFVVGGERSSDSQVVEKYVPRVGWFVENNIYHSNIFRLLPVNFQNELKIFANKIAKKLLVCFNSKHGSIEFYDFQHKSWNSSPVSLQLPNGQCDSQFALLGSMLYAFGGMERNYNVINKMWSLDLSDPSSQWTARADMNQSREEFCSVIFNDTIYVFGGVDNNNDPLRMTDTWREEAPMKKVRWEHEAIEFNRELYVVGGLRDKDATIVEKYVPTIGWVEDSSTNFKMYEPHLFITPRAYLPYFKTPPKEIF
ncbi:hypothetical protein TYRP_017568 [Tyrophagus putrescentiae]|nr:hypothetical protein TYRP_017568 [Tyrophagus putrescentiae]